MATEISQSKTICILAIVAGCFAVLWPSLFYPMLKGSFTPHSHTGEYIYFYFYFYYIRVVLICYLRYWSLGNRLLQCIVQYGRKRC